MFNKKIGTCLKCCLLLIHIQILSLAGNYQDQTSSKTNTLDDDADDIQRQLDNEARDRLKYGRPKTVWVLQFPTYFRGPTVPMRFDRSRGSALLRRYDDDDAPEEQMDEPPLPSTQPLANSSSTVMADNNATTATTTPAATKPMPEMAGTPLPPPPDNKAAWDYATQENWTTTYPACGGRSQSPVNLPARGIIRTRGARSMLFQNYGVTPIEMSLTSDGNRVIFSGKWKTGMRPLIYGGAAHSRRYVFHSLTFHTPSEHRVGNLNFPLESQAYFISAEYKDWDEAMASTEGDPQAILGVFGKCTHPGTSVILDAIQDIGFHNRSIPPKPLSFFHPPFKEYVCYQGSLTVPPCSESVLWIVRARSLCLSRCSMKTVRALMVLNSNPSDVTIRAPQPLNDRSVYFFN